jgi:hypothetical protein
MAEWVAEFASSAKKGEKRTSLGHKFGERKGPQGTEVI